MDPRQQVGVGAPNPSLVRSRARRAARRPRSAYTLFELVLVLALLVVMATLVYPSAEAMYDSTKVSEATDNVRARWAQARAHAVNEGRPYRFAVVMGKGNYRIAPDTGEFWSGGAAPETADTATRPFVVEEAIPKGVRFATADNMPDRNESRGDSVLPAGSIDSSAWHTMAVFLPDGSLMDDVELLLVLRGARPTALRMRALTGSVTVRPHGEENRP